MKDEFSLFIEDGVWETTKSYYELMDKTKRIFFDYLIRNKKPEQFVKEAQKIWENVDHSYMQERIEELEKMISAKNSKGHKIINPDAIFKRVFELNPESKFIETEIDYLEKLSTMYQRNYKVVEKDIVDKIEYLSKNVKEFEKRQATIPYYNKNGTIRAYHDIASYLSMLYNVNMTRSGWNRTFYDANLLNNDLAYLPAHPYACPLCIEAQGRIYSISGKSNKYPPKEAAMDGTYGKIGHPNCRHQWTLYWDEDQVQEDKFNDEYWRMEYEKKQKKRALELKVQRMENDKIIYNNIGDKGKVDRMNKLLQKAYAAIDELS